MNGSGDGGKPAQTGLVDMGIIHFYDAGILPSFTLSDLANYKGSFSEMVLNVTWAQLEPVQGGALDTSAIDSAIAAVNAYNAANGTDLGIKLRIWGGFTAPDWAKDIDGPAITIGGQASVDPSVYSDRTIGRVWTADYVGAWTGLIDRLAGRYDGDPVIRGISQTAGGTASDEPFVALSSAAPTGPASGAPTVNQLAQLKAGGYSDAAQMLTLRAAIADYAAWSTTPLDYTLNPFHLFDSGTETLDQNFAIAVLQQARNSTRLVQAGNHALDNPQHSQLPFLYAQMTADAALTSSATPASYQTASPDMLATHSSSYDPGFTGTVSNWPAAVANGVAANGSDIELWDFSGPNGAEGFLSLSTSQVATLARMVASGVAPVTGAPNDGRDLGFVAPAFVRGAAGTVGFSGTDAVLLASRTPQDSYTVTLTSLNGHILSVGDVADIVDGPASGTTLTFSGSLAEVNTVLASLADLLPSGSDIVRVAATDSGGHSAVRTVGVKVAAVATSPDPEPEAFRSVFRSHGLRVLGGVQASLAVPGDLLVGRDGDASVLLAALSPGAYSSATLSIGGTLDVATGGAVYFTGRLAAPSIRIDGRGLLSGGGTLDATGDGAIANDGTIEAMADTTLGLQQLEVVDALTGSGTLRIDAGATLALGGKVAASQTIRFAANTAAQLADDPYSPSRLVLGAPRTMQAAILGFTSADRLVLQGVTITGASYADGILTVGAAGGPLTYRLAGDLADTTLDLDPATLSQGVIRFLPSTAPIGPAGDVVDQIVVRTRTILADQVTVEGSGGVALDIDGGGVLALAGGAVVTAGQAAIVGDTGQGTLVLMGGALDLTGPAASNALVLGADRDASGTVVNLEQITADGMVVVGAGGQGALRLLGVASSLSDGGAIVGEAATAHGSVLVNGGEWTNAGELTVGGAGRGTLRIDGSHGGITGQVTAYNARIGNQAGSRGRILLDGGELLVANFDALSNTLAVGVAGTGELALQDGSEVAIGFAQAAGAQDTGQLTVGGTAGGRGRIDIGNDSSVLVYGDGTVGGDGAGVVAVGGGPDDTASLALLGTLGIDAGGRVVLGGDDATVRATTIDVAAGGMVSGAGTLSGDLGGNRTVAPATIENDGTIRARGGTLRLYGDVEGTGTLSIASHATLTLQGAVGSDQSLVFASHATVVLADPASFHGTIMGFDATDTLVIGGAQATGVAFANGLLTVDLPSGQLHYAFAETDASSFTLRHDALGGTRIQATDLFGAAPPT